MEAEFTQHGARGMQAKGNWDGNDRRAEERRRFGRELTNAERQREEERMNDRRHIIDRRRAEIHSTLHR
jgi:hypothetical protein